MMNRNIVIAALAVVSLVVALTITTVVVFVGRDEPQEQSNNSDVLMTNNVLWEHQEGHLCLQKTKFQSFAIDPDEPDVILVQEIIDDQMYTYEMINTEELLKEDPDRFDQSWIDILEGVKYNCQVEPMNDDAFDTSDPLLLKRNDQDGTTLWSVAHWTVQAGSDLRPRILHFPDNDSQDGVDTSVSMDILSVDDCAKVVIEGCDPATEAGDDHVPSVDVSEDMVEDALRGTGHQDDDGTRRKLLYRHLQGDFVPEVTRTNWCGPGTPKNTVCPSTSLSSQISGYDYSADNACRRHDHGTQYKKLNWLPRTECMNDRDLVYATNNWAIEATFGFAGLAGTWGCYAYGPYYCWKGWRYGKYCCGPRIRYGLTRYNSIARYDGWGYYAPMEVCPGDLWRCNGSGCEPDDPKAPETTRQCA